MIFCVLILLVAMTPDYVISEGANLIGDIKTAIVNEQPETVSEQPETVSEQPVKAVQEVFSEFDFVAKEFKDSSNFNEIETVSFDYDIVIYGGGLQAVAAAVKAAETGPGLSIALIVPYPDRELGGIGTTGGQNFWDTRSFNDKLYQGGTFTQWHKLFDTGYSVQKFSDYLIRAIEIYDNIDPYYCRDIKKVSLSEESNIKSVEIGEIYRDNAGYIAWSNNGVGAVINGDIFIDASEDCRLLRLGDNERGGDGSIVSVGRYDWPIEHLSNNEILEETGIQMSATLMFKVKGIKSGIYGDMSFGKDGNLAWGGNNIYENSYLIKNFNDTYGPMGFSIKAVNASRDGEGSDEWWVNCFVIYNVDARAASRDLGTENYPDDMLTGSVNTDEAWIMGKRFLYEHRGEMEKVLREFDGFHNVEFICDSDGYPVIGDMLYIRESVHMIKEPVLLGKGTENLNYAVTTIDSLFSGADAKSGSDLKNHPTRIGIGFYYIDVHPYIYHNEYFSSLNTRLDITNLSSYKVNPVYIPYEALITEEIPNLIAAGYGSSISSIAWSELRVAPNIIVMGDAAGVAAAYCKENGLKPAFLEMGEINDIQGILAESGAILEK